jgi:hypothetical protein
VLRLTCKSVVLICLLISVAGCASYFKRKDCEKTNWYQHGHDVAMAGKRLDADDHVKQCQKVEAKIGWTEVDTGFKAGMGKYCTGDNVFAVGKAGKPFSYEMCDGESEKKMRQRYSEGIKIFCTPSNAYRFGTSGGVYLDVCPKETEDDWLVEYRKGRKIWLNAVILEKERQVTQLDHEVRQLENQRQSLAFQQSTLGSGMTTRRERVYDQLTGSYKEVVTQVPDEQAKMRSQQLSSEISNVNHQIQRSREKQSAVQAELSKMRTEMATL